jgi:hypothetical protein
VNAIESQAAQLDPGNWQFYNGQQAALLESYLLPPSGLNVMLSTSQVQSSGSPAPNGSSPPSNNGLLGLTDNNLSTFVTLTNSPVLLIDLQATDVVDRVVVEGSANLLNVFSNQWPNYSGYNTTPPLGLINVYVGNTPTSGILVGN